LGLRKSVQHFIKLELQNNSNQLIAQLFDH